MTDLPSTASAPPLDEVMLAMDVVDTLRAQRALVEAELDDEGRERALVERVQAIYATQGIDVPRDVVRQGVEALRADRFTYRPPERGLAVRLAEAYVDRRKWAVRLGVVLVVVGGTWGWLTWREAGRRRVRVAAFAARVEASRGEAGAVAGVARTVETSLERARAAAGPGPGPLSGLLDEAATSLAAARGALESALPPLPAEGYDEDPAEHERRLAAREAAVRRARDDLGVAQGRVLAVERLRDARADLARVLVPLEGRTLAADQTERVREAKAGVEAAIEAADPVAVRDASNRLAEVVTDVVRTIETRRNLVAALASARGRLAALTLDAAARDATRDAIAAVEAAIAGDPATGAAPRAHLDALVDEVSSAYELRIVSGEGERSGIWRHPEGRTDARNYYLIVTAVDVDGRLVPLRVRNEEDGSVAFTSRFGVRVKEEVYERVKADKLDNGVVDAPLVGRKARGTLAVEFVVPVLDGRITRW